MLTVTTAAEDPTLLTLAEVAEALGGATLSNTALQRLNARVSELLAGACNIERAGASVMTLRAETLTETIRIRCPVENLYLGRKPVIEIVSVTESDVVLTADGDFELTGNNSLQRIQNDCPSWWETGKTVVVFRAGFEVVPPGLKELAAKLVLVLHSERGRDPSLGSMDIPGVISETYRYGRPDDPLIPAEIIEGLRDGGFMNLQTMVA